MLDDFADLLGVDSSELGEAVQQMQETYADGIAITQKVKTELVDEIDPSHQVIINIELTANVDGKKYYLDAELIFLAELEDFLNLEDSSIDEMPDVLDELKDVELDEQEESAVLEQLSIPRALAVLDDVNIRDFELYGEKGLVNSKLNESAVLLMTKQDGSLLLNFEEVFTYPQIKEHLHYAIPSAEKMQDNIIVDIALLDEKFDFEWEEEDNYALTVQGTVQIKEL